MTIINLDQTLTDLDGKELEFKTIVETAKDFFENLKTNVEKAAKDNPTAKSMEINYIMNLINISLEEEKKGLTIREAIKRSINKSPLERTETKDFLSLFELSQKIKEGNKEFDLVDADEKKLLLTLVNKIGEEFVPRIGKIFLVAIIEGKIKSLVS